MPAPLVAPVLQRQRDGTLHLDRGQWPRGVEITVRWQHKEADGTWVDVPGPDGAARALLCASDAAGAHEVILDPVDMSDEEASIWLQAVAATAFILLCVIAGGVLFLAATDGDAPQTAPSRPSGAVTRIQLVPYSATGVRQPLSVARGVPVIVATMRRVNGAPVPVRRVATASADARGLIRLTGFAPGDYLLTLPDGAMRVIAVPRARPLALRVCTGDGCPRAPATVRS